MQTEKKKTLAANIRADIQLPKDIFNKKILIQMLLKLSKIHKLMIYQT